MAVISEARNRKKMRESQREAKICGRCGGEIGDKVYRVIESSAGFLGGRSNNHVPVCRSCITGWDKFSLPENCVVCSREVRFPDDRWREVPTCSDACKHEAYIIRQRERRNAGGTATCETCGDEFESKRKTAKYCSPACRQKAHRQKNRPVTSG